MFAAAGSEVEPAQQGIAAALASTTLEIGSAVGLAVLVAIADAPVRAGAADVTSEMVTGFRRAGFGAAVIALIGVLLSAALVRHQARQSGSASGRVRADRAPEPGC